MKTDRDFARACLHFLAFIALGAGVFACMGTPTQREREAKVAKEALDAAAPLLPPPFNYLAEAAGLAIAGYAAHKTTRHIQHRRARAKLAAEEKK